MRYLIKNARITVGTTKTGQYAGQKYSLFQADLFDEGNPFGNPNRLPRYYTLNQQVADVFQKAADKNTTDSTSELEVFDVDMSKVPEEYKHIPHVFPYTKILQRPYGRLDRATGNFVVAANGAVTPITSITIYSTKKQDNEISSEWMWVEDVDAIINRILERNYRPLEDSPIAPSMSANAAPAESPEDKAAKIAELQAQLAAATQS